MKYPILFLVIEYPKYFYCTQTNRKCSDNQDHEFVKFINILKNEVDKLSRNQYFLLLIKDKSKNIWTRYLHFKVKVLVFKLCLNNNYYYFKILTFSVNITISFVCYLKAGAVT